MSTSDITSIEHTLSELEMRIQARIGKWALAIIGSCIGLALMAASQWFPTIGRIEKLETWKTERAVGIDEYSEFRRVLEGRLTRLEGTTDEILRLLKAR